MAKVVDYCGIYSGHRKDKSGLFQADYGLLQTAPLIMSNIPNPLQFIQAFDDVVAFLAVNLDFDYPDNFLSEFIVIHHRNYNV
jgi:hypothetical protein